MEQPVEEKFIPFIVDSERRQLRDRRIVLLSGCIDENTAGAFIQDFELLSSKSYEPITLIIVSNGGDVSSGLACIRAIKKAQSKGIKVIGQVHGHSMSMAFLILQCCDIRIMGKLCTLMAHGVTTFTVGDMRNVEAERKLLKYWQKELANLLAKRCTAKGTEYATPEFWHKILEDATPQFYSSEECLKMGLIDKVE